MSPSNHLMMREFQLFASHVSSANRPINKGISVASRVFHRVDAENPSKGARRLPPRRRRHTPKAPKIHHLRNLGIGKGWLKIVHN